MTEVIFFCTFCLNNLTIYCSTYKIIYNKYFTAIDIKMLPNTQRRNQSMKRVLVGGMSHESNSFNPIIACEKDFSVIRGNDLFNVTNRRNSFSGVVNTLQDAGYEIVPILTAGGVPNGEVDKEFYLKTKAEFIERAKAAQAEAPIDAICLALHGSMRIKDFGEAEGPLMKDLREIFPDIPLFSALDPHTTMTQMMYDNSDGLVSYKCSPHTDAYETGVHAAKLTITALEKGIKVKSAWVKVPLIVAGEQSSTNVEPAKGLREELIRTEQQEGILAASYLMCFPWSDNPDNSVGVYVVAEDQELADKEAIRLAQLMWDTRKDFCFLTENYSEKETLDIVFRDLANGQETPVYISDSGDNPTAGSSGDCTGFLRLLIEDPRTDQLRNPVVFGGIYDPNATLACKGKVGQELTLTFGAYFDNVTTQPITATGTVMSYIEQWGKSSVKTDLALFRTGGVDIVLASEHVGYTTPEIFRDLGRNPAEADIVVCKLGYLTAAQAEVAKRSILALSKGSANEDLTSVNFTKLTRPIFPLDGDFEYDAAANLKRKG